ncbi:glycoside hydrolase superfamily [Dimargaris cristalligena]|uniref:chitinase n=1 Tax=Dimargaris cristalligena TaxID=215637 RepID=A0A4P9ZZG7_9FUNG|nr:glycoside hydrolase superfamily [Dimargaris cristalligena]|eukprot:RKP38501.1 glycoside hydrolase superfamily [Dimargaris cristalligena]
MLRNLCTGLCLGLALSPWGGSLVSAAFDASCNSNLVNYWGQNSYGAANPSDSQNWEKPLADYCRDDTTDVLVLSFLHIFNSGTDRLPGTNFANHCDVTFPGTDLLYCPDIGKDVSYCQSRGKKVLLSLGGAAGSYGFANDADAVKFASTIWNLFLGGSSDTRPFGSVQLDGIDLDIEGGSSTGYAAFVKALRNMYSKASDGKHYLVAAAPQCPYPDAYMGPLLSSSWVDMVFVQFYNNFCGVNNFPRFFNFEEWQNWADKVAVNKNVKVYLGVAGSPSAASFGYVGPDRLAEIINDSRPKYPAFGGVMIWDASQSYNNKVGGSSFAQSIKSTLRKGQKCASGTLPSDDTSSTEYPVETKTSNVPIATTTRSVPAPSTTTSDKPSVPSKTKSGSPSTPTDPSDTCVVEGSPCTNANQYTCNGYDFAQGATPLYLIDAWVKSGSSHPRERFPSIGKPHPYWSRRHRPLQQ